MAWTASLNVGGKLLFLAHVQESPPAPPALHPRIFHLRPNLLRLLPLMQKDSSSRVWHARANFVDFAHYAFHSKPSQPPKYKQTSRMLSTAPTTYTTPTTHVEMDRGSITYYDSKRRRASTFGPLLPGFFSSIRRRLPLLHRKRKSRKFGPSLSRHLKVSCETYTIVPDHKDR